MGNAERTITELVGVAVASKRRKHSGAGDPGIPAAVMLFLRVPEDALVAGELELLQAYCAQLVNQVFLPALDSDPDTGDDQP